MRIVVAASYHWQVYAPAFTDALTTLGVEVIRFEFDRFLASSLASVEIRLGTGPHIHALNQELFSLCIREQPDVVLIWNGLGVWPQTVRKLSQHFWTTSYTNDDPFGSRGKSWFWSNFRRSLTYFSSHHVYRDVNLLEYRQRALAPVALLRSYFVPELHFTPSMFLRAYTFPVSFIGHGEPYRTEVIRALAHNGISVAVFGPSKTWDKAVFTLPGVHFFSGTLGSVDYRHVIWKSQICLGFLSRQNRDDYTRRYFEIPACGGFLLAERTPLAQNLYEEGKQVEYFSSPDEAVAKCLSYLPNQLLTRAIALAGHQRCMASGYDVKSQAARWLDDVRHFSNSQMGAMQNALD